MRNPMMRFGRWQRPWGGPQRLMNRTMWWSRNRYWLAPMVALGSGALVWTVIWQWSSRQQGARAGRALTAPLTNENSATPSAKPLRAVYRAGASVADEGGEPTARTPAVVAEVLRRAPQDATDDERALVWGFLRDASQGSAEGEALWLVGADEALSWLRGATQSGDEVETGFVELVQNTKIPAALRDFALQHLGIWAEEHAAGPLVLLALQTLVTAESASPLAGHALQALCRSCFAPNAVLWIRRAALQLATNPNAHPQSKIAAIEAAGHCGFEEIEPPARELLIHAQTVTERITALQVLGWVGSRGTLEWLETQPLFTEVLTAAAQKQALRTLRQRWEVGATR